jgi:hypothetical protein
MRVYCLENLDGCGVHLSMHSKESKSQTTCGEEVHAVRRVRWVTARADE